VELYPRSADCFDPNPLITPLAEGWIDRIVERTPNWLILTITDEKEEVIALLGIPYVPSANP
jgi:hypothetical protein